MSSSRTRKRKIILTDVHRRMYALEKDENFRWIYKLLASRFPEPLPPSALVDASIEHELATIGQFAELAHGSVSPPFVWANLEALMRERYPLEGYTELRGSRLLETFVGNVANLQGYMAHRPAQKQLVVAFSGTSALCQVRHELNICLVPHPDLRHESRGAKVHAGFFGLYTGLRTMVMGGLRRALLDLEGEVEEVIVTGHSLGGVMACFCLLDLLRLGDSEDWWSPQRLTLKLATFGSPRLGNMTFVQAYKMVAANFRLTYGEDKLKEYAVRGYNDGTWILSRMYASTVIASGFQRCTMSTNEFIGLCSPSPIDPLPSTYNNTHN